MEKAKVNYDHLQVKSVFDRNPETDRVILTTDGNVFLPQAKNYVANHCKQFKVESAVLLRSTFEKSTEKDSTDATNKTVIEPDPLAWRKLPFGKLKEYAETTLGLTTSTLKTKGAAVLLAEIDALIASKPSNQTTPVEGALTEGTPGEETTNHISE